MTTDETDEVFVYKQDVKLGRQKFTLVSRNLGTHDELEVLTHWNDNPFIVFDATASNKDKKMIADAFATDARWAALLMLKDSLVFDREMLSEIHDLIRLGLSEPVSCTMTASFYSPYYGEKTPEGRVVDIYKQFIEGSALEQYQDTEHDKLLRIYFDLSSMFSTAAADNILKAVSGDFNKLIQVKRELSRSVWPECSQYVSNLSIQGLEIMKDFRLDHLNGATKWVIPIIKIISELSEEQIARAGEIEADLERSKGASMEYYYFFFKFTKTLNAERPWIAGLMVEKYGMDILRKADNILIEQFTAYELTLDKLIIVSEYIHRGGNSELPFEWIVEL